MKQTITVIAGVGFAMCIAHPAVAQQSVSDVLEFLVTNQSVSTGSVERDRAAAQATSETISGALLGSLATLPVPSTSGAFAYRLNPALGTVQRATQSFGPFFIERALTAGRTGVAMGVTFQHMRFTELDGRNLRDGSLVTTANKFVDESQPFDVDQLALKIDADVATLYANLGVTDRMEVGFAAPVVALRLDGSRVNTYRGQTFTQAKATATAIGLADLVLRTKYTLFDEDGQGLAAAVDVRLPTGREQDLLGAGSMSTRFSGIGSLEGNRVSAHANAGITFGGLARELSYGAAFAAAATPRVTLTAEMLGRWVDSGGRIESVTAPHPTLNGVETIRLAAGTARLQTLTLAPGVKWNVTNTWVLVANVSLPLTQGGLNAPITPFFGVDYSLQR